MLGSWLGKESIIVGWPPFSLAAYSGPERRYDMGQLSCRYWRRTNKEKRNTYIYLCTGEELAANCATGQGPSVEILWLQAGLSCHIHRDLGG